MKHFLDITKDHCPMTFVKVKLKLEKIDEGDQLEVLLTEGEPLRNVPKSAAEQGHKIVNIEPRENGHYQVVIEK
jgi:tRNA 2-thiouridine synthesizing protein A